MCIRMRGGSWLDSGVAGSPVVSGGLVWEGVDFFYFFRYVVLGLFFGVVLLFCGFFRFVLVLFWYCCAIE